MSTTASGISIDNAFMQSAFFFVTFLSDFALLLIPDGAETVPDAPELIVEVGAVTVASFVTSSRSDVVTNNTKNE